jgi:two-component system response regulator RegA
MKAGAEFLLVDDDPLFTEVMQRGLERRGFSVRRCASAEEALNACTEQAPDYIVLDLNMPGTSGLVILPALLSLAPRAELLVLTGYSSIATAVEATRAGARNYLCKPAGIDEVLAALDESNPAEVEVSTQPPSLNRLEWEHLQRVLQENDGNISATARALGMHRRTLQRKLQKRPVRR